MAEHAQMEYATAQGNDLPAHEATYDRFVHLTFVACALAANVILALAIGAVAGHWLVAVLLLVIAAVIAVHGFGTGARLPSVVMVLISLLALALSAGSQSAA